MVINEVVELVEEGGVIEVVATEDVVEELEVELGGMVFVVLDEVETVVEVAIVAVVVVVVVLPENWSNAGELVPVMLRVCIPLGMLPSETSLLPDESVEELTATRLPSNVAVNGPIRIWFE